MIPDPLKLNLSMKNRNIVLLHYGGCKAVDLFVQREVEVSVIAVYDSKMTCAAPDREMIPFDIQSSRYKNQECSHCFFLFLSFLPPRSFFFSFPFPSLQ